MTRVSKGQGPTAKKVVELADGTRTTIQIAEELGVSREYVTATIKRQGIRDKIVYTRSGESIKVYSRRLEGEVACLRAALGAADKMAESADQVWEGVGLFSAMKKDIEDYKQKREACDE